MTNKEEPIKYKKNIIKTRGLTEVPASLFDKNFWKRASAFELIYSMTGLILGLVCIIGGIALFFHGVSGSTSWVASFVGAETKTSDAAPGVILFIVGLIIVWITRYRIRIRK